MRPFKKVCLFILLMATLKTYAQIPVINMLDSGRKTSLRGLSVVNDNVLWASGSNGTVVRSTDGGKTFEWQIVQGYEQRDFRDIEAFDANTAIIMAVAEPAIILKTKDAGKTWKKVFEDTTKGMFLDAMDFYDLYSKKIGFVVGDPINNIFYFAVTNDGGETWKSTNEKLKAFDKEGFFASSGTNVKFQKSDSDSEMNVVAVTGGTYSRLLYKGLSFKIPGLIYGKESQGANSIAVNRTNRNAVIVGGDFANDKDTTGNCVTLTLNKQTEFKKPQTPPHGYRSCVEYITKDKLITCGTSGIDISNDGGMNWTLISTQSFHVCQKAKKGSKVFLAGANGKIGVLE